jgi:hypothetical protein
MRPVTLRARSRKDCQKFRICPQTEISEAPELFAAPELLVARLESSPLPWQFSLV